MNGYPLDTHVWVWHLAATWLVYDLTLSTVDARLTEVPGISTRSA